VVQAARAAELETRAVGELPLCRPIRPETLLVQPERPAARVLGPWQARLVPAAGLAQRAAAASREVSLLAATLAAQEVLA
jgi:hypothetical protein